jgi:hypothetical protein
MFPEKRPRRCADKFFLRTFSACRGEGTKITPMLIAERSGSSFWRVLPEAAVDLLPHDLEV